MMSNTALHAHSVSRIYNHRPAVVDASLSLHTGQITCLLGPSGCGKSTLLRVIAGLEPVDAGEIAIGGMIMSTPTNTVLPENRGVGLVFQDFALFPHLNVVDNIAFGLMDLAPDTRQSRVNALLERFRLAGLADAWPHTLSGGEQQRVAIARALAREPAILLLDEPFSGLDGHLRAAVRQSVIADLRTTGAATLIVTHDPLEAMLVADHLVLMAAGRILQTGTPQECYLRPATVAAAQLLGDTTILPGQVEGNSVRTAFGVWPALSVPNGPAEVMVRPEAVRFGNDGIPATVIDVAFAGSHHLVSLASEDSVMTVRSTGGVPSQGSAVSVIIDPLQVRIFPTSS